MKIYTKGGDQGSTSLFSGRRVSKDDVLVWAYGTVDELNSVIGLALSLHNREDRLADILCRLQHELFELGADMAADNAKPARITDNHVRRLEQDIDDLTAQLPPLSSFILPGGHPVAAHLHQARAVCRRAERLAISASQQVQLAAVLLRYLNRLSDLLFTLARAANHAYNIEEPIWTAENQPECDDH